MAAGLSKNVYKLGGSSPRVKAFADSKTHTSLSWHANSDPVHNFKFPPRCKRDIRSFAIFRRVEWQFLNWLFGINYQSHPQGPDRLSRNVGKKLPLQAA
jgi:hypothetical protein